MYYSSVLFVLAVVLSNVEAKHLPSYIKPCKINADLSKCAKEHATETIPVLIKGDKKFHLQSLSPMHLDKIDIKASNNFEITLTDVELMGLGDVVLEDLKIDLEKQHIDVVVSFKVINIQCQYTMDGRILVLQLKGSGPANLTFEGLTVDYMFDYKFITKKDGKKYIDEDIVPKVDFTIKKQHYDFQNLFNGNQQLGEQTNKLLNENPDQLSKDLGSSISETISAIVTNILKLYLPVIPFEEIFVVE